MENPYQGNYHDRHYYQTEPPAPDLQDFEGNSSFASASLVMGILSITVSCCFFPAVFLFAGLGILFSCLSKGSHARLGTAKAGLAVSSVALAIFASLALGLLSFFMISPEGKHFLSDYVSLFTSDSLTEEQLYDFLEKYGGLENPYGDYGLEEEDGSYLEPIEPYDNNGGGFYFDNGQDFPDYQAPVPSSPGSHFI